MTFNNKNYSRIAFIFLIFSIISGGNIQDLISCQTRYLLKNNLYFKHLIGYILVFVLIMMEGGWDFNDDKKDIPTDWSNGNVIHSSIYAVIIYILFLLIGKSRLKSNLILMSTIGILYLINTQRNYYNIRKKITKETNKKILYYEKIILIIAFFIFIYGLYDYILYQKKDNGENFTWKKFILGNIKCSKK